MKAKVANQVLEECLFRESQQDSALPKSDLRPKPNSYPNDVSWMHRGRKSAFRALSFVIRHLLWTSAFFITVRLSAADLTPESVEFFERKIRPVLVERCY